MRIALGVSVRELPVTDPTPGLILREVAPVTDQFSVMLCPECTVPGEAVKLEITGDAGVPEPPPNKPN